MLPRRFRVLRVGVVVQSSRRRGVSILYAGLLMVGVFGLVSLAVDLGRVRVARMQLSTAADAAALAGVTKVRVPDLTAARQDAKDVAAANVAIVGTGSATSVSLQDSDVIFGLYRSGGGTLTPAFTAQGQSEPGIYGGQLVDDHSCNACKIDAAQRTSTRGNPVGLFFGPVIGLSNVDVAGRAIAWTRGMGNNVNFGIVGLDWIKINGTTNVDSYNAGSGAYGGTNIHDLGTMASNGTITLVGNSGVRGNLFYGTNSSAETTSNTSVTGWKAPLEPPLYPLTYPVDPPTGGYFPTSYNNQLIASYLKGPGDFTSTLPKPSVDTFTIPGGTSSYFINQWNTGSKNNITIDATNGLPVKMYIATGFTMSKGTLTINCGSLATGKVTFFVSGSVKLSGGAQININVPAGSPQHQVTFYVNGDWDSNGGNLSNPTPPGIPGNLYISMTGIGRSVDISTQTNAHIMAPLANVTFHGNNTTGDFYGWVIGKTLTVTGNSNLHYDESLPPQTNGGQIHSALVK